MKPPVFEHARLAWSDLSRALSAMPVLALAAAIAGLAYVFADILAGNIAMRSIRSLGGLFLGFLIGAVWSFFMVPLYLGIHRFIILNEFTGGYSIDVSNPRFVRFFGWMMWLSLLGTAPSLVLLVLGRDSGLAMGIVLLAFLAFVFFSVRIIVLFPAIAVDAPGVTLANSFGATRGHFWRIAAIAFFALLPVIIFDIIVSLIFAIGSWQIKIINVLTSVAGMGLAIAVASRLYLHFADPGASSDRARSSAPV